MDRNKAENTKKVESMLYCFSLWTLSCRKSTVCCSRFFPFQTSLFFYECEVVYHSQ